MRTGEDEWRQCMLDAQLLAQSEPVQEHRVLHLRMAELYEEQLRALRPQAAQKVH